PVALARRLIRRAWRYIHSSPSDLEYTHVEKIMKLHQLQVGKIVQLPRGVSVERRRDEYIFSMKTVATPYEMILPIPGEIELPEGMGRIRAEIATSYDDVAKENGSIWAYLSADATYFKVRTRRSGDKYRPFGFNEHKKLKEAMSEASIPLSWRNSWPVLLLGDKIAWVPHLRIAQDFKVKNIENLCVKVTYIAGVRVK
ncbi:MAG: tRNA lysidine(34) synthetase TilS, partial [bacterium]|nr:tRNA lysidine(34) synthetase TilS [bacterium]